MTDGDSRLILDIREEGTAELNQEVEDSMLIWQLEGGAENARRWGRLGALERQSVEGRKHRELELHIISGGGDEGDILGP